MLLEHLELIWVIAAMILAVLEVVIPAFVCLLLAGAALVTAAVAYAGAGEILQLATFGGSAVVLLLFLRPWLIARQRDHALPHVSGSRASATIGRVGRVTVAIDPLASAGRVEVDGEDWAATAARPLAVGTVVRVLEVDGIVLSVEADRA